MAKYNDIENLYKFAGIGLAAIAASGVTAVIDCLNYEQALLVISTETLAAGYVGTVTIEDSADGTTGWAIVDAAATITIADTDDDSTLYAKLRLNTAGTERYIRATLDIATAAGPTAVMLIVGNTADYPVETKVLQFDVNTGVV